MTAPVLSAGRRPYVEIVRSRPGISTRDVARAMGVDATTAEYHLKRLAAAGIVVRERAGRIVAHYEAGLISPRERRLARLSETARRALALLEASDMELRAWHVAQQLGVRVGPIRYAMNGLVKAGLARKSPGGWYGRVQKAGERGGGLMAGRRRRMAVDVASCLRANLRTLDGKPVASVELQGALVWITTRDGERVDLTLRYPEGE